MVDGLYLVKTKNIYAGFVVEHGRVVRCAPILRKRLAYWITIATRIEKPGKVNNELDNNSRGLSS
jgi:hypothetical protein